MLTPLEKNYYDLIILRERTLEQVPNRYKENIKQELIENGYM